MERRQFIAATGATITTVLAGCLGNGETGDPESLFEALVEAQDSLDYEAFEELQHSESVAEIVDEEEEFEEGEFSMELEDVDVSEEGLSVEEVQDMLPELDEGAADVVAEQENALVSGDVEINVEMFGEEIEETDTIEIIAAEEDGDWLMVGEVVDDPLGF